MTSVWFRCALSCLLAFSIPMRSLGADRAAAMLYTNSSTWIDGRAVPQSAAVFAGEMVQTRADSSARINASGSSVMVVGDSLVKYEGPQIDIEHGTLQVATSRGLATKAGELTIKPAENNDWTVFQVAHFDGRVQIVASKGDLTLQDEQGTTKLSQGQQTTRDDTANPEKKKRRKRGTGAEPAAQGGIMNSTNAILVGSGIVGGVTAWVLLQGEKPLSPVCPNNSCP